MKKSVQCMVCVIGAAIWILLAFRQAGAEEKYSNWSENGLSGTGGTLPAGATYTNSTEIVPPPQMSPQELKNLQNYSNWSENDLFRTGRALSEGATLTNSLKTVQPPEISSHELKTTQNPGIDISNIKASSLQKDAIVEIGKTWALVDAGSAFPKTGTLFSAGECVYNLWNAWRVGTGRASPDVLRSTIPHVVMAWDAMKGSENLPTQTFTTQFNRHYDDGSLSVQTKGTVSFRQDFSTTAPGKIGKYGFDPYTDTILREIKYGPSTRIETFDGSRFNKMNHDQSYSTPKTPTYTPSPRYTPSPTYHSNPSFRR